ncbi:MAG: response regulator transcription factor [Clostridia bacterium]|nr:response regulator transcription factor [Clostridia bacterium]
MKIAICDDDIRIAEYISNKILEYKPEYEIEIFSNSDSLTAFLSDKANKIDLLFMDIVLNDENGIDAAAKIEDNYPDILTVFVTAFADKFSEEIFLKSKPYGYLHKPIKDEILHHYLDCAKHDIEIKSQNLSIKIGSDSFDIPFSKIIYIESEKRLSHIHVEGFDNSHDTYAKLDEIQSNLDTRFIRCHKSYIVNADYIKSIEKDCFIIRNGTEISISKAMHSDARVSYFKAKGRELK